MDLTPTSQDTLIISRNTGGTKTDDGNLSDLTFQISLFESSSSKDEDRNLTVLTAPYSQVSNNDNNNCENLTTSTKDDKYKS